MRHIMELSLYCRVKKKEVEAMITARLGSIDADDREDDAEFYRKTGNPSGWRYDVLDILSFVPLLE